MSQFKTLLVPHDFSEHSKSALDTALELAEELGSQIHLLHVFINPALAFASWDGTVAAPVVDVEALAARAASDLKAVAASVQSSRPLQTHVETDGSVADIISRVAGEIGADLIVMGTHGRTGLAHVFIGSVAERTLRQAPCPVLTVRGDERSR